MPKSSRSERNDLSSHCLETIFMAEFREDLRYFVETDRKLTLRLLDIVEAITRSPFDGIGKPEPLKYLGPGVWSRRLTDEHRVVYRVEGAFVYLLQCRYHY